MIVYNHKKGEKPFIGFSPLSPIIKLLQTELFIFLPALYLNIFQFQIAECLDKGTCQTSIGDQWNIVIDRSTTDAITIC